MTDTEKPASAGKAELCLPPHLRKPNLRRWEASEYLELKHGITIAAATLAKVASTRSDGPRFFKSLRTPLYPVVELDRWAAARLGNLVRSTSDAGVA